MPIGIGQALWAAVLPKETTNLITNPSIEFGTAGWAPLGGGASIGSTSYTQAFGAWSLQVNHTVTSEGAFLSYGTPAVGSYMMTAFFKGTAGHRYRILSETATGGVLGAGSVTATGGWDTVTAGAGVAAGTGLLIVVRHVDSADGTFYVDGVQLESGTFPTTYIDGDQAGGTWLGAQHQSASYRPSQFRGGGSVVALADLGLSVDQFPGAGVMPIENSAQSYAVTDGAQFQRQRAASRTFTLTAKPIVGTSLADFHVTRRTLWDVFKPDLVTPQQPISFLYYGGQGTIGIQAYYAKGLELGNMDGPIAENAAISFAAYDPYWYFPTQQGTTLAPRNAMGSANAIIRRDTLGRWGSMGAHGTSLVGTVDEMLFAPNGVLYAGGRITSVDGTVSRGLVQYSPTSNRFGSMGGTLTPGAAASVRTLAWSPWGSLYIGGAFTTISGTATRFLAQWNGNYGSLIGGTANGEIYDVALSPAGTLFLAGAWTSLAGTTSPSIGQWVRSGAFGSLVGQAAGTVDDLAETLTIAQNDRLYFAGLFGSAGGTAMRRVGQWRNGTFGSMSTGIGMSGGVGDGLSLGIGPNGVVYLGGQFGTVSDQSGTNMGAWNGVSWSPLGNGLGVLPGNTDRVEEIAIDQRSGNVYAIGRFSVSGAGITFPDNAAVWNGYTWLPLDVNVPASGTLYSVALSPTGDVYIGGNWAGTVHAASVVPVVNRGRSIVYPNLRLRNLSSGTARIYQLINPTTSAAIYFNLSLLAGEQIDLVTMPGARSFTSSFRGNIFNSILPGSNLATFNLLPGTNYVSFFSDNDSLEASFFWTPRSWSIDGGTVS